MSTTYTRIFTSLALVLATFSGQLIDQTTSQPLTGVHVQVSGPAVRHATTNAHGRFTLKGLRPGAYTVSVQSADVPPQTFHVTLAHNRTTVLTMKACSTTLDYHCASAQQGGGPG